MLHTRYHSFSKQLLLTTILVTISTVAPLIQPSSAVWDLQTGAFDSPLDFGQSEGLERCQNVETELCNITSYTTIVPFNNSFEHKDPDEAIASLNKYFYLFHKEQCRSKIQLFLCSLYFPVCVKSPIVRKILLPCRDDCEDAKRTCEPLMLKQAWPVEWDCTKFNYNKDDKLCVINNAAEGSPSLDGSSSPTNIPTSLLSLPESKLLDQNVHESFYDRQGDQTFNSNHHQNSSACEGDMFDCKIPDPDGDQKILCIDPKYVCNGIQDCIVEGQKGISLDEVGCNKSCSSIQFACDGKCIESTSICDGKFDCSQGIDEQNCDDYLTGLVQSVLCIVALFSVIYLLIRFFRIDYESMEDNHSEKSKAHNDIYEAAADFDGSLNGEARLAPHSLPQQCHYQHQCQPQHLYQLHLQGQRTLLNLNQKHTSHSNRLDLDTNDLPIIQHQDICASSVSGTAIYQDPSVILNDYERLISMQSSSEYRSYPLGGKSGRSSVSVYACLYQPTDIDRRGPHELQREPPAPPPPTPAPSTPPPVRRSQLYVNMLDSLD